MTIFDILAFIGGLCLFLFAMNVMVTDSSGVRATASKFCSTSSPTV